MIIKTAEMSKDGAQQYLQSKLDKGAVNLITPTLIGFAVRRMFGLTVIGFGIDIMLRLMGVDFESIINECYNSIMNSFKSDPKSMTPEEVDSLARSSVDKVILPSIEKSSGYSPILKISSSGSIGSSLSKANPVVREFLAKSVGFIFKASFAAIGMELFADFIGKPLLEGSGLNLQNLFGFLSIKKQSKQKKFAPNLSVNLYLSSIGWKVDAGRAPVMESDIKSTLNHWANEIYPTIDNSALENSQEFKKLIEKIYSYNYKIVNLVDYFFIPKDFETKKDVIDYFIDDVAAKSSAPEIKVETKQEQKK